MHIHSDREPGLSLDHNWPILWPSHSDIPHRVGSTVVGFSQSSGLRCRFDVEIKISVPRKIWMPCFMSELPSGSSLSVRARQISRPVVRDIIASPPVRQSATFSSRQCPRSLQVDPSLAGRCALPAALRGACQHHLVPVWRMSTFTSPRSFRHPQWASSSEHCVTPVSWTLLHAYRPKIVVSRDPRQYLFLPTLPWSLHFGSRPPC